MDSQHTSVAVAWFVHGRGRGHASRSLACMRAAIDAGYDVHGFAGGDALDMLGDEDFVTECQSVARGIAGLRIMRDRLRSDSARIARARAKIVVSDGDGPSLMVAKRLGIPTIALGHDLVFTRCRLPVDLPKLSVWAERTSAATSHGLADIGVAVNFLPLALRNAQTSLIARPDRRPDLPPATTGSHIAAYFRDGDGASICDQLASRGNEVHLFGKSTPTPQMATYHGFDQAGFAQSLASCRAAVGSAGSNLLAECVMLQKPVLAVYAKNDHEQQINALMIQASGVGHAAERSAAPASLTRFLSALSSGAFRTVNVLDEMPPASKAMLTALRRLSGHQ